MSNNLRVKKEKKKRKCSYKNYLTPIRITFGFLTILMIIVCIFNSLFYGLDFFLQNLCHLVHHDQSFFISFISGIHIEKIYVAGQIKIQE